MPSLSRREALRAGIGVAAGVGLAGCSSDSPVPEVAFESIRFLNADTAAAHTATVFLFESGEPVYRATMDGEPARETEEGTEVGGGEFEGYPTEPGRYELYAWYEEQDRDDWSHVSFDAETVPTEIDGPLSVEVELLLERRAGSPSMGAFIGAWKEIEPSDTSASSMSR